MSPIVNSSNVFSTTSIFQDDLKNKNKSDQLDFIKIIKDISNIFELAFNSLSTEHKQMNFYKESVHFIEPKPIINSSSNKIGYYVPFKAKLESLLSFYDLNSSHEHIPDVMNGNRIRELIKNKLNVIKSNKNLESKPLMIALYYDDIEVVNAIGNSRKKHKLGVFYWSLLNLKPFEKYSLSSIQLLAVSKTSFVRKDNNIYFILRDFIENINMLNSIGIELNIYNRTKTYVGFLSFCLGDTPALNLLGGFKESVSMTYRFCRSCYVIHDEMQESRMNRSYRLRNIDDHLSHIREIENSANSKIGSDLSTKYGINGPSCLLKVDNFDICSGLLHDPMHIFFEGICHVELKALLSYIISSNIIKLEEINKIINDFDYFYLDKHDIPNKIDNLNIKQGAFTQTSSQMKVLFHNLPIMLRNFFTKTDKHWMNFLNLLNIINLSLTYCYDNHTINQLNELIESYVNTFITLYPHINLTPKFHFLRHFPLQMANYGPLRFHSTFKFEAKHRQLKSFKYKCFKNISNSVSFRQELWMLAKKLDFSWDNQESCLKKIVNSKK